MSKTAPAYPPSPYSSPIGKANPESHTLSVLVDNEPGVLARVVGLFSARSFNIESLTVAEVAHETHLSRITIVDLGHARSDRAGAPSVGAARAGPFGDRPDAQRRARSSANSRW